MKEHRLAQNVVPLQMKGNGTRILSPQGFN